MDAFRTPATTTATEDLSTQFLSFRIGGQLYGLPISNVIEIVQLQPISPMPELPPYVKGIINMRGKVIPIIDINLRFGMVEKAHTSRTCFVIVDIDGYHVGFVVDEVNEVMDIGRDQISPPPVFQGSADRFVVGIGKLQSGMILLLESRALLSDHDLSLLNF